MLFIFVNLLFLLLVFTGIGLLFPWNVVHLRPGLRALLASFWIGWATAIGVLQLWHFFFPVGSGAFIVLVLAGAAGWWRSRRLAGATLRSWKTPQGLALAGLAMIPAGMLANHVLFITPNSDYALYHLQTLRWFMQYAIVPGLGNVFGPLAWNCSSFLYTAAINSAWLSERAYYLSDTLPSYVILLQTASGLYGLLTRRPLRSSDLYYALMIPIILLEVSTAYIVAYSPDPLIFYLQVMLAGQLVELFDDEPEAGLFRNRAAQMVLIAATAVCVKLSFAVFGLLCLLTMVILGILRFQNWPWRAPRLWLGWIGLGLALVLPWMGRSVVLTGYLIYPNTDISFPVPWKIPFALADVAQKVVELWAKTVNGSIEYTADIAWFQEWWRIFPFFVRQTFIIALGLILLDAALLLFLQLRARRAQAKRISLDPAAAALVLICAPALIFWFVMGPSYRFSGALFWILLVAAALIGLRLLEQTPLGNQPQALALSMVLVVALWLSPNHFSNNLSRKLVFLPPTEASLAEKALPRASIRQWTTASGLVVNIPPDGTEECWDAPQPCTTAPNFLPGLREIEPGNPQKGYQLKLDD